MKIHVFLRPSHLDNQSVERTDMVVWSLTLAAAALCLVAVIVWR